MNKRKSRPEAALQDQSAETFKHGHSTAVAAQQRRLLAALRQSPLTTLEAREHLDILHPAARVMELREQGYVITTHRTMQTNAQGNVHRVAQYVLMASGVAELCKPVAEAPQEVAV